MIFGRSSPLACAVYVLKNVLRRQELRVLLVKSLSRDGVERVLKCMFENKTLLAGRLPDLYIRVGVLGVVDVLQ